MNADVRLVAGFALDFVFTEPVIAAFMPEESTAMGVDVNSIGIGPDGTGSKLDSGMAEDSDGGVILCKKQNAKKHNVTRHPL